MKACMKKSRIFSIILYLIVLHCLSVNARDDRVNFTVFAPWFSSNQIQDAQKFKSAFSNQNNYQANTGSKAQFSRINQIINHEQSIEKLSFFGQWRKKRADAKRAEIVRKSLAVIAASKRKFSAAPQQSQVAQQALPQQVTKKSNIVPQEIQRLREHNNNQVLKAHSAQDNVFQQVIDNRSKAFVSSIDNPTPTVEHVKINDQTRVFLQAQGIDTTQFQQMEGLPIQHQLIHELVDVLDAVAEYALHHQHEIYQTHLTKYCAHLASLSQQSNIESALEQAIDGTNCCHGITHYLEGMVSGVAQAYQQFHTALDYFDAVADSYGDLILQHGAQGVVITHGLEAIVTAGMITASTATIAATGVMIGAAAYVMAPVCFQALMDLNHFSSACITGDWDKVTSDLDNFGKFISSQETVARMAELAGGVAMPTPNLSCVVEHILSLRPVITSVQNASGEMVQSLYLMTKNQLQKVYTQGVELLQLPEFINFNMKCEKNWGSYFFDILPQSHPALVGMEAGLFSSGEQAALTSLFAQAKGSVAGNVITSGASSIGSQAVQIALPKDFIATRIGQKMLASAIQDYEKVILRKIAKDYENLIVSKTPENIIDIFCICHEKSLVPENIKQDFIKLHELLKKEYPHLTMQMRHIFYPSIQPKFNEDFQFVKSFQLNGFHHDEYSALEKSGSVQWKNKIHGKAEFEAEECFMADIDFGDGVICKRKTFFSSSWSREKTARIIFEAAQNRIEDITEIGNPNKKFLCQVSNLFIEIIINSKNTIISAYPSLKNF